VRERDEANGSCNTLTAVSEATFDVTRKSQSGRILFLNNGPIVWESKLQSIVTLSSAESEYIAF
jgi:hypothetical protein